MGQQYHKTEKMAAKTQEIDLVSTLKESKFLSSDMLFDIDELKQEVVNYIGGNITHYYDNWVKICQDKNILDIVENGLRLEFSDTPLPNKHNIHPLSSITS